MYRVGNHDVYFIPVYTAGAGGVVAQLGTIAAVGAAFNGEYFVGLGDTQEEAFKAYLKKVSGVTSSVIVADDDYVELAKNDRINILKSIFEKHGLSISEPTSIQIPVSYNEGKLFFFTENDRENVEEFLSQFIDNFVKSHSERVFMWNEEQNYNIGIILVKDGITEMHYVSIEVGN